MADPAASTSESFYPDLLKELPLGVVVYRLDDPGDPGSIRLVQANKAASRAVGLDVRPFIGQTFRESSPELLETEIPAAYAEVARTGESRDLGVIELDDERTGHLVFEIQAFGLPDRHVGVVFEELTQRRSAEEARLLALVDNLPGLAWSARPDGHIDFYNRRWYEYTGTTPEAMEGWGWSEVHDPEVLPEVIERWTQSLETGEPFEMEFPLRAADGTFRWFLTRARPLLRGGGEITRWVGTNTDIDEHRRFLAERNAALERAEASEARYRFMSETLQQQIWTAQPDGQLDYVNHYTLDYFGRTFDEMIGQGWQGVVHEEDLPQVVERWARSLETGEPYEVEFRLRCSADGSWRWHLGRASALRGDDGQVVKWFGANTDIHAKKEAEAVWVEANRVLEERVAERTQVIAAFSEDLKALHRITTTKHEKPKDFYQDYLRAGCVIFEMPIGILSETPLDEATGERVYRLHTVESPLAELEPGMEVSIHEAFCDAVVERNETVSYADAAEVEDLACHAAYAERGLRAFIGTPIYVDDELFGTLNFVSPEPRPSGFASHEHELIEVMAELVGRLLSANRAERTRIETDARYRSVVQTIEEGLLLVDAEGRILMSNPAATYMLGLREDAQVLGRVAGGPRWPLVDEDGMPVSDEDLPEREVLRSGQPVTGVVQGIVYPDGTVRWVSVNARPADVDDKGEVEAIVVSLVDITEIRVAESRVRATNAFLQQTLDALGSHIAILDENFNILAVNAAWKRFGEENGLSLEQNGVGASYLRACEDGPAGPVGGEVSEGLQSVLRGERERFEIEYPCHSPDEERWFLFRATRFEGFDELRLVVAHEDVTGLKKAEREMGASEAQLQKAQQIAQLGSWRWDIAADEITWSDELFRIFGVAPAAFEPTFEKYLARVHAADREALGEVVRQAVGGCESYEIDHRIVRPSGEVRHIHSIGEVVLGDDGEPVALQGTAQDVTEAYEAGRSLEQLSRRLEQILDSAGEGIYGLDLDGTMTFVNRAAADMIGWDPDALLGQSQHDVLHHHRADGSVYPVEESPIYQTLHDGEERRITGEVFWRKDGTSFPVEYVTAPMRADGEVVGAVVVFQDVTERVRSEQDMRHYAAQLEERNAELEQFAYVASHDLQEPLRMVSSFLQLLQRRYEGQLDETADEYIAYAVDGASRMKILIQELLAYSRIGTRGKAFEPVDVGRTVETVLGDLKPMIEEAGASVEVGDLPTTKADASQLGQVFQNLIGNAVKFSGDALPEVRIAAERTEAARTDGGAAPGWRFAVSDNGIGIAAEHAERIFQIFQRLHTRDEYEGTGIGLAMCKKIVERHGGRIWLESAPGEGATFYFTLPDQPNQNQPSASERPAPHAL